MTIRRVVTGHDASGNAIIVEDRALDPLAMPGIGDLYRVWSADEPPTFPGGGADPAATAIFPPVGGFRFFIFTLEPHQSARPDDSAPAELAEVFADDEGGFHETDTIDFEVVLAGEATLTVRGGQKVTLKAGDTIVHNGASHAWSNEGSERAVLAGCLIGAHRNK